MPRRLFYGLLLSIYFFAARADAQQLPRSIGIGSNPAGSLFYSLASGLAKVISDATPMQAQVQPYAGTSTFVPLFDSGELDLTADVKQVKSVFAKHGIEADLRNGSVLEMPYADDTFDTVLLISILELYQQSDGSVLVPDALRPYMHAIERIGSN